MADIAGLNLMIPSSVAGSGVSVSATGKVSFTAADPISVNGCFTSTYDNYLIIIRAKNPTSLAGIRLLMRASGSDSTTTNSYVRQYLSAANTSVGGARSTASNGGYVTSFGVRTSGAAVYMFGPALAQPTAWRSISAVDNTGGAYLEDWANTHNQSTAYDGFTLDADANLFTGALCVYGLAQ